jgi:hypothetical protein
MNHIVRARIVAEAEAAKIQSFEEERRLMDLDEELSNKEQQPAPPTQEHHKRRMGRPKAIPAPPPKPPAPVDIEEENSDSSGAIDELPDPGKKGKGRAFSKYRNPAVYNSTGGSSILTSPPATYDDSDSDHRGSESDDVAAGSGSRHRRDSESSSVRSGSVYKPGESSEEGSGQEESDN